VLLVFSAQACAQRCPSLALGVRVVGTVVLQTQCQDDKARAWHAGHIEGQLVVESGLPELQSGSRIEARELNPISSPTALAPGHRRAPGTARAWQLARGRAMKAASAKCRAPGQPPHANSGRTAQGMALIEALVASAVLGIGLAAATRLTLHTLHTASDTRQHTVALALALDAMDCLQSGRSGCSLQASTTVQGTTYNYSKPGANAPRSGLGGPAGARAVAHRRTCVRGCRWRLWRELVRAGPAAHGRTHPAQQPRCGARLAWRILAMICCTRL
jgi:type II secretory pathway pseudopilin PulG